MLARRLQVISFFFAGLDAAIVLIAFITAYVLRHTWMPQLASVLPYLPVGPLYPLGQYAALVLAIVGIWLGTGYVLGLYRARELQGRRQAVLDPTRQVAVAVVVLGAGLFFVKGFFVSRLLLALFIALDWALQVFVRLAFLELAPRLRDRLGGNDHILLVGTGPAAQELAELISESKTVGMDLVGFVDPSGKDAPGEGGGFGRPVWRVEDVPRLLREQVVDEVFFAVTKEELGELEDLLLLCEEEGVRTRLQLKIFPHLLSRVYVEELRHVPLLTFTTTPENENHLALKRLLDALGAGLLLLLLAPVFLLLAVLIKLTSRGPVIYSQIRCGVGGRRFSLHKFRSMVAGAHEQRGKLAEFNEADGPVFKIANDPRCTPVGRWLRRLSLDELPQLWNIFKGDMSFVGPRPPLPEEVENYQRWQRRRLRMRPGLTCLWALEGRSRLGFDRWMKLDLAYIDSWSLWLDLKIFLKTIPVVLSGRGSA